MEDAVLKSAGIYISWCGRGDWRFTSSECRCGLANDGLLLAPKQYRLVATLSYKFPGDKNVICSKKDDGMGHDSGHFCSVMRIQKQVA